jgi:hypothetical protein
MELFKSLGFKSRLNAYNNSLTIRFRLERLFQLRERGRKKRIRGGAGNPRRESRGGES